VRALTGTDPDRLPEEKARGITIDLGFAHAELGEGIVASFVDVPGHERFVRHMLAGAHGIDAVLLVVAADESVMPQTREHFHICRLLGVPRGLVALSKCDVADTERQAEAALETAELVAGSFLAGAPVLRVSARTGAGLPELRAALLALAQASPARPTQGLLRLPIDRVFSMKGFGCVVTGTLVAGTLAVGDEVEALPSGRRARVRGLQVHGEPTERAAAGTRTAVNLAGIETFDLARGEVLVEPASLRASSMLDVELSLLPDTKPLKDGARVRVHVASAEALARVRLLETGPLEPGRSALAQLRLEAKVAAGRHDRLVIRSYSPAATIGGAIVVDPLPPKRRVRDRTAVERLRDAPALAEAAQALVEEAGAAGIEAALLAARMTVTAAELAGALASSPGLVGLGSDPAVVLARSALDRLGEATLQALESFHRQQPLRPAMPREELRARVFGASPAAVCERVAGELAAAGRVRLLPDAVALAGHAVRLNPGEEEARRVLLAAARAGGLAGFEIAPLAAESRTDPALLERVTRVLVGEKLLVRVGDGLLVERGELEALKQRVRERWSPGSKVEVGAFKELTGLTRKHAIPLLEYLDRERVTRRLGALRVVI
jgi:selenocysteine-specific elongation factor